MPLYSRTSQSKLDTCEGKLIVLFERVIIRHDCTILCGVRSKEAQQEAFDSDRSQKTWPNSMHNVEDDGLSMAVDVAPYPIIWDDLDRFRRFAYYVIGVADGLDINVRWGGAWSGGDFANLPKQNFDDLVHFELIL